MSSNLNPSDREFYQELEATLSGYWLTDLGNFCSLLYHHMKDVSWVGFYLSDGKKLRLAHFMGKPACIDIAFDRGVCGSAFSQGQALIVGNVHEFPGHIACDAGSQSELVAPFFIGDKKVGVLDLDSYVLNRFHEKDLEFIQGALQVLVKKLPLNAGNSWSFS